MAILFFWASVPLSREKVQYLGPWAKNWKNKNILLSQTLKVQEKKVSLVFWFVAQEPRYWQFLPLTIARTLHPELLKKKCFYLGSWANHRKSKDTLLSQTLKVEEKKVTLVFWFVGQERRYGHFFFWRSWYEVRAIVSGTNCQYLGSWATNKKNKDTFFSSTLKV